jgi:hypothetical protein
MAQPEVVADSRIPRGCSSSAGAPERLHLPLAMKHVITALAFALGVCLSALSDEVRTNAPIDQLIPASKGTRIWISSFAPGGSPIKLSTEQRDWPPFNAIATPPIPIGICQQWRTNYAVFRQLLISASEKAHLDSESLAKIFPELDPQKAQMMAILPVEVQSAEVNGELAWVISYRWETLGFGSHTEELNHILERAFAQKTLKEVWGLQCN